MPKPTPLAPEVLTQPRLPCACQPQPVRPGRSAYHACPACYAWEHGQVVLVGGATVPKAAWVLFHLPPEEEVSHG